MATVRGELGGSADGGWDGHRVWVGFDERVEADGTGRGWTSSVRQGNVARDGSFAIDVPDESHVRGPVSVAVVAPDWSVLVRRNVAASELARPLSIPDVTRGDVRPAMRSAAGLGRRMAAAPA